MVKIKKIFIVCLVVSLLSCTNEIIVGKWENNSKYSSVVYKVSKVKKRKFILRVLSYNDGTMKYKEGDKSPFFSPVKLFKEGNSFIDGSSGATNLKKIKNNIEIVVINEDSLEVKKRMSGKTVVEYWKRQ